MHVHEDNEGMSVAGFHPEFHQEGASTNKGVLWGVYTRLVGEGIL